MIDDYRVLQIAIISILLTGVCRASSPETPAHNSTSTEASEQSESMSDSMILYEIETLISSTNSLTEYCIPRTTSDLSARSLQGAKVLGYYYKGAVIKLDCIYYGERLRSDFDMYFKDKELRLVEVRTKEYNQSIYDSGVLEIVDVKLEYCYFAYTDSIIWLNSQGKVSQSNTSRQQERSENFREIAEECLAKLSRTTKDLD